MMWHVHVSLKLKSQMFSWRNKLSRFVKAKGSHVRYTCIMQWASKGRRRPQSSLVNHILNHSNWPFQDNYRTDRIHVQWASRGTKRNVFPRFDVKDNCHFIMTSFRRHICSPKISISPLSGNGQLVYCLIMTISENDHWLHKDVSI